MSPSFCLRKDRCDRAYDIHDPNTLTSKLRSTLSWGIVSNIHTDRTGVIDNRVELAEALDGGLDAWSMLAGSVTSGDSPAGYPVGQVPGGRDVSHCGEAFQPLSADSLAVAWPIPVDEPVISTVFLFHGISPLIRDSRQNDVTTTRLIEPSLSAA